MPKSLLHRKLAASIRYLFPRTRARALVRLSKFRYETLPSLSNQAKSRIYRYIVYRQNLKSKGHPSILQRLRSHTQRITSPTRIENEGRRSWEAIGNSSLTRENRVHGMNYQDSYAPRGPGQRRRKLAGYLKAANDLRQTYTAQYAAGWSNRETQCDQEDDTPGNFRDIAVVCSGEEEMILFPSYARKHMKKKPEAEPGTIQETDGQGRDVRGSAGAGDAEFWRQQWNNYEDDYAIVDVDVRGWIYSPHKGQMSRKQRLFIGLARQLVGVSGTGANSNSTTNSREGSPQPHGLRERMQLHSVQHEEELAAIEAQEITRKEQKESSSAASGIYSERPAGECNNDVQQYRAESTTSLRTLGSQREHQLSHSSSQNSLKSEDDIKPVQKRASWQQPADMSSAELAEANARLMTRLRHFLAVPMANTPISVFFYNDDISRQRTVYTDVSGHFSISAALDFVPTHVRILASDKLSATEGITITESVGISVISDIDDTIKHSAISSGAREIFRNVFIRDLGDLTIEGVKEWYNRMADMGVKFHYVSNSPWQLFPVISKYFSLAGLPPGSFHLKQYSGMLQGIFEPVAERKKVTLDKIARDFPERNFILIGDSGEADLEVYTEFVLENPGRVVAVFIRDVTTSENPGFFDPSSGFPSSQSQGASSTSQHNGGVNADASRKANTITEEDDPDLNAAIAASLQDLEEVERRRAKSLFPELDSNDPRVRPKLPDRPTSLYGTSSSEPKISTSSSIDLSPDDEVDTMSPLRRVNTDSKIKVKAQHASTTSPQSSKPAPPLPRKPVALRSPSNDSPPLTNNSSLLTKSSPPKSRQPASIVNPSPLAQQFSSKGSTRSPSPPKLPPASQPNVGQWAASQSPNDQTYTGMARDKLWSMYNSLPALRSQAQPIDRTTTHTTALEAGSLRKGPPPPLPRKIGNRNAAVGAAANAASFVGAKASSAWQYAPAMPIHSRSQMASANTNQLFSTSTAQDINKSNTRSAIVQNSGEAQYVNKREHLWRQRWAKAEDIMAEKGVVLRSWRIGSDAIKEAEQAIKNAERSQNDAKKN